MPCFRAGHFILGLPPKHSAYFLTLVKPVIALKQYVEVPIAGS